jgi:SNF2 family DNA or RNA helicase
MPDEALYELILERTGIPYEPVTPPRRQQLAGMAFLACQGNALFYFGMRTGKTKLAFDWFMHCRKMGLLGKGVSVVPNPVIRPVWEDEALKHAPGLRVRAVGNDAMEFVDRIEDDTNLLVVSWSSLQYIFCDKHKNRKGDNKLVENVDLIQAVAPHIAFGTVDEIHGAKNHETLRFNICKHLFANAVSKLGMTGTPFGRDPYSMWAQAFLVDGGECLGKSFYFFRIAYGKEEAHYFAGRTIKFDPDKKEDLAQRMQPLALSYTMTECGIKQVLPSVVRLPMTKEQERHYIQAVQELVEVNGEERRKNNFSKIRMIASGYVPFRDENEQERFAVLRNTPKLDWLEELVEGAPDARIVIFHEFTQTGRLIGDMLKRHKLKFGWLWGGTSKNKDPVKDFQAGKINYLLLNNKSGNAGIDLRRADYQCFFESPTSPILRQQAEARALGDRGDRGLYIDDLICSKVEERILSFHKEGMDLANSIVFRLEDML